jgi:hypothetical protein
MLPPLNVKYVIVLRIRDGFIPVSGFCVLPVPDPGFRIPDPGSRIPDLKALTKERAEKEFVIIFLVINFSTFNIMLFCKC